MANTSYESQLTSRLQLLDRTHLHTKALFELADEAAKYHDKYLQAMEKFVSCLLDNSDCMEEMRKLFDREGEGIAPTYEITGSVETAFKQHKSSTEVKTLRETLTKLADSSLIPKRQSKATRVKVEELEAVAKRYAKQNTPEKLQKMATAKEKQREKFEAEQKAEEARLAKMDAAVMDSMHSLCSWWAESLATQAETLHQTLHQVGNNLAECFQEAAPSTVPPTALQLQATTAMVMTSTEPFPPATISAVRDDASSYVGVTDIPSQPPSSQLPRTMLSEERLLSPVRPSSGHMPLPSPSPPPPLYSAVSHEQQYMVSAPPDDSRSGSEDLAPTQLSRR